MTLFLHQRHGLRIGDVEDFHIAADVLIQIAPSIEVDNVLPSVKRFDGIRIISLDRHVVDVLVRIPNLELTVKWLCLVLMRRRRWVLEATGDRIHPVTGRVGCQRDVRGADGIRA